MTNATPHLSIQIILDEHEALSAMLRSLAMMIERGPGNKPDTFFDVMRAMLFYIDEFPEKRHHPKESALLFPAVAERSAQAQQAVQRLNEDHQKGEAAVRQLQHLLLAWELLGASRRKAFEAAFSQYLGFYREHMQLEETVIIPQALQVLTQADWQKLDEAFASNADILAAQSERDPVYDQLFSKITLQAPAPIGLGDALEQT